MKKFNYEEINLEPRLCQVDSRSECDTSLNFGGFKFKLPVVPSNMQAVIDIELAKKLSINGYFYIMHRFDIDNTLFVKEMKENNLISSISIGVNKEHYTLIDEFIEKDLIPDFITIDIAHGHSKKMKEMLRFIKLKNIKTFIIAGNVSSKGAILDLQEWGADAIKVGIGPGSACTTWPSTGFGSRNCQASVVHECSSISEVPIIADGGINCPGDISKSLVLGATFTMIGGMLSGFRDSPGNVIEINGNLKKEFWGSASQFQSGKKSRIEGKKILIDYKDRSILDDLKWIEECLQSSISYAGGKDLQAFNDVIWF